MVPEHAAHVMPCTLKKRFTLPAVPSAPDDEPGTPPAAEDPAAMVALISISMESGAALASPSAVSS